MIKWSVGSSLTGASPLSPVIKSLVAVNEPAAILHRGRTPVMRRIEARFRFLAVREQLRG